MTDVAERGHDAHVNRPLRVAIALTVACGSRTAPDEDTVLGTGDDAATGDDGTAAGHDASQCQPPVNLGTDCQAWTGGASACADDAFGIQCGGGPETSLVPSPFLDCQQVDVVAPRTVHWCCFCPPPPYCKGCGDIFPIR